MGTLYRSHLRSVTLLVALCTCHPCLADDSQAQPTNGTVLGGGNTYLADGSLALQEGRIEEGIRLTLRGLKDVVANTREEAAAHSNLCGGYALLREWDSALTQCNAAIALDPANWQALNNRAAIYAGQGRFDLALEDLRTGLALDPKSSTLLKSMAVVEHNQKVLNKRHPSYMHS
jgi:tetratricopeptide (TPR) repeat protein